MNKVYSVSEAIQIESGTITVTGMIASVSTPYKVISKSTWVCENPSCKYYGGQKYSPYLLLPPQNLDSTTGFKTKCPKCNSDLFTISHEYRNARTIQIEDIDKSENNDRLEVLLYDKSSTNVIAGEVVDITGGLMVQRQIDGGRGKKLVTVLHSNKITYKNKEEVIVTPKDIEVFHKWKKICDIAYLKEVDAFNRKEKWSNKIIPMKFVDRLVAMFSPNVVGHEDKKQGILRSLVGGLYDHGIDNGRRGRINTFLVGDPGTAKSIIARESTKIFHNSRYITAQNASGKSLVGIVDKENDSLVLRLGAAVLAKGSICAINETQALEITDQQHLLDIAEEGRCTLDKYGRHFEIDAPTTIIATANPYGSTWSNSDYIDKDEIPTLKTFLDRFDQVFTFRDTNNEDELRNYTEQKTKLRKRRPHNYNFLRKYFTYVKAFKTEISDDAEARLNKFWILSKLERSATTRTYDSLFRIAEAQARLNLSPIIDDDIIDEVMMSVSRMLSQYGKIVRTVESPRDTTLTAFLNTLKQCKSVLSIKQLCEVACQESKDIQEYLGNEWRLENNRRLKNVIDILKNTTHVKITKSKPMTFLYNYEHESDLSDQYDKKQPGNHVNLKSNVHYVSDKSDTSDASVRKIEDCTLPIYIHRIGHSDRFFCDNCRVVDDRHYMRIHICSNSKKK